MTSTYLQDRIWPEIMEIDKITRSDIIKTGVSVAPERVGSHLWRVSADLATRIANDPDFQMAVRKAWKNESNSAEETIEGLKETSRIARDKFGKERRFDAHVEQASYLAVIGFLARTRPVDILEYPNPEE